MTGPPTVRTGVAPPPSQDWGTSPPPLGSYLGPETGVAPSPEQTHTCENITSRRTMYADNKNVCVVQLQPFYLFW